MKNVEILANFVICWRWYLLIPYLTKTSQKQEHSLKFSETRSIKCQYNSKSFSRIYGFWLVQTRFCGNLREQRSETRLEGRRAGCGTLVYSFTGWACFDQFSFMVCLNQGRSDAFGYDTVYRNVQKLYKCHTFKLYLAVRVVILV